MKKIYPNGGRINYYVTQFGNIALRNYHLAKNYYEQLKNTSDKDELYYETIDKFTDAVIITCIFSAMATEAFINDYAAACLGDSEFYSNFDSLSLISKLQLICKFILQTELDKSAALYSCLKKLVKDRNEYIHSKSRNLFDSDVYINHTPIDYEIENQRDFEIASNAIKVMKKIAAFFDANDTNAHAMFSFFGATTDEFTPSYIEEIINEFK